MVADPVALMVRYLAGQVELTNDEREILLFALYCESRDTNHSGLAALAVKRLQRAGRSTVARDASYVMDSLKLREPEHTPTRSGEDHGTT